MIRVTLFIPPGHPAEGRHTQEYGDEWSMPQVLAAVAALDLSGVDSAGFDVVRPPVGDALTAAVQADIRRAAEALIGGAAVVNGVEITAEATAFTPGASVAGTGTAAPTEVFDLGLGGLDATAAFEALVKRPKTELQGIARKLGCDNVARQRKYLAEWILAHQPTTPTDEAALIDEAVAGNIREAIATAENATELTAIRDQAIEKLGESAWTDEFATLSAARVAGWISDEKQEALAADEAALESVGETPPSTWHVVPWRVLVADDVVLQDGRAEDDESAMWTIVVGLSEANPDYVTIRPVGGQRGDVRFNPDKLATVRARRGESGAAVDTLHAGGIAVTPLTNGAGAR